MPDDASGESSEAATDDQPRENGRDDQPTVSIGSDGFQPDAGEGTATDDDAQRTTAGVESGVPSPDREFDWRGWVLVGVLVLALVVVPLAVTLRPVWLVGFKTTYLVLPLVPAFLLGATAVWVAIRSRQG